MDNHICLSRTHHYLAKYDLLQLPKCFIRMCRAKERYTATGVIFLTITHKAVYKNCFSALRISSLSVRMAHSVYELLRRSLSKVKLVACLKYLNNSKAEIQILWIGLHPAEDSLSDRSKLLTKSQDTFYWILLENVSNYVN